MKNIGLKSLKPFDVLLYPRKKLWFNYYHCAWYVGKVWGMRCNYESKNRGPELEDWPIGDYPQYVLRLKTPLNEEQKVLIVMAFKSLKDRAYDYLMYLTHPLRKIGLTFNNPDKIRCDECISIPLIAAGIKVEASEERPRGFLKSPVFEVYELKVGRR